MPNTILINSHYSPALGGHAPGDVRDSFAEAAQEWLHWREGTPLPTVEVRGCEIPIDRVCGLAWNCTDTMPSSMCEDLEIERGSTYAQGARHLKAMLKKAT